MPSATAPYGELLGKAELRELTRKARRNAQLRVLDDLKLPYRCVGQAVLVSRQHVREWLSGAKVVAPRGAVDEGHHRMKRDYPLLRQHKSARKDGPAVAYYYFDRRSQGLKDLPLGKDYEAAIRNYRRSPRRSSLPLQRG